MDKFTIDYTPLMKIVYDRELKLSKLGRELGLSPKTVAKFRKKEAVSLTTIGKLCAHLEVPIEEIVRIKL